MIFLRAGLARWPTLSSCIALALLAHPPQAVAAGPQPVVRADSAPDVVTYGRREDLLAFVRQAAERQGFDAEWAAEQLAMARYQPSVAKLVMPPPTGR